MLETYRGVSNRTAGKQEKNSDESMPMPPDEENIWRFIPFCVVANKFRGEIISHLQVLGTHTLALFLMNHKDEPSKVI